QVSDGAGVSRSQPEGAKMRLIPGYEVYWRDAGVTQIGVDPKCAVVLSGLSGAEQTLLGDLPRMFDIGWLRARGNELGLGRDQVAHLQQRLADSGVLIDIAPAAQLNADERYWHMAARAGVRRKWDRSGGIVEVRAGGRLGVHIGTVLAEAGVGTVLVTDVVRGLGPGAATRPQQGQMLRPHKEAPGVLRAANPHVRTNMAPGQRPQLVVTVDQHVIDPVLVRHLLHDRVPQLSVLVTELTARIGPFTRPGEGACSTCLALHRSERGAGWCRLRPRLPGGRRCPRPNRCWPCSMAGRWLATRPPWKPRPGIRCPAESVGSPIRGASAARSGRPPRTPANPRTVPTPQA